MNFMIEKYDQNEYQVYRVVIPHLHLRWADFAHVEKIFGMHLNLPSLFYWQVSSRSGYRILQVDIYLYYSLNGEKNKLCH